MMADKERSSLERGTKLVCVQDCPPYLILNKIYTFHYHSRFSSTFYFYLKELLPENNGWDSNRFDLVKTKRKIG